MSTSDENFVVVSLLKKDGDCYAMGSNLMVYGIYKERSDAVNAGQVLTAMFPEYNFYALNVRNLTDAYTSQTLVLRDRKTNKINSEKVLKPQEAFAVLKHLSSEYEVLAVARR